MPKDKIFISHSSKDIAIVQSFVENVLRLGLDIPAERIFCSSMEGHDVKSGQYIPDRLRQELKLSSIAFLFISENYRNSEVCLNELGAAWVTLDKENVIPVLLPGFHFDQLGFLNVARLGVKIYERSGILKLIQDCQEQLNPSLHLDKLHAKIDTFVREVEMVTGTNRPFDERQEEEINEWKVCFEDNLIPFDDIIRQAIPAENDGIYKIKEVGLQNKILSNLSKANFLKRLWYKHAGGDYYVERLIKTPSGTWLVSLFNWEIKISTMWVSKNLENQYEFILLRSEAQEPFKIDSDAGGVSYNVGMLKDGTVVTENERLNGYAIINGETTDLNDHGVEPRIRHADSEWVFLVSDYHKAGYNADETIEFCRRLDAGEVEVNEESIMRFLWSLGNHPVVLRWR